MQILPNYCVYFVLQSILIARRYYYDKISAILYNPL